MSEVMVSVCMITYNHEAFIREALDGVLMQQTSFPFELVIGEDCSTDRTREICLEYKEKYPDKIRLLLNERNLGIWPNLIQTLKACAGKYIALCEGDDYWTDPMKLQKQVDFLEGNEGVSLVFGNAKVFSQKENEFIGNFVKTDFPERFGIDFFLSGKAPICNNTVVFYKDLNPEKYPDWANNLIYCDKVLQFFLIRSGDFAYINNVFSVYRIHEGGITSATKKVDSLIMGKKLQEGFKFELKGKHVKVLNTNISHFHIGFFYFYLRERKILKALKHFIAAFFLNPFRKLKSYKDYYYMYFK